MSRGIGRLQRDILDRLQGAVSEDGWPQYVNIGHLVRSRRPDGSPTRSQRTSVGRAVRNLEERGLIGVTDEPDGLHARLPLDARQLRLERERERRAVRNELRRFGWPGVLWWCLEEEGAYDFPSPSSRQGRRLIRAGLPPDMLDREWWEARIRDNHRSVRMTHEQRSWYDLSDVPAHLRFQQKRPSWTPRWEQSRHRRSREPQGALALGRDGPSTAAVELPASPQRSRRRIVRSAREMDERIASLMAKKRAGVRVRSITPEPRSEA
jgi:hypothetical protein